MIFVLLSFFSVPLEGSGDAFLGYYPTEDTLYNVDVSKATKFQNPQPMEGQLKERETMDYFYSVFYS